MGRFIRTNDGLEWVSDSDYPHTFSEEVPETITCSMCGFKYQMSPRMEDRGCFRCIGKWKKKHRIRDL